MKRDIVLNIKTKFENAQTIQELEDTLEEINKEMVDLDENSDAFKELSKISEDATKEVGELNEKVKDLNGQSGKLKGGIESLTSVTDIFGGAMGDLFSKLENVGSQITKLSGGLKSAASSARGTSKAMRILKVAIASTGIGLLVIALGSLVSYFTQTQRGADKVSKALAGLRAGVAVIVDRFSKLGEGLVSLFKGDFSEARDIFKDAVSGIAEEIANETKQAATLESQLQALERREVELITVQAKRRSEIERLKLLAQENFEDSQKAAAFTRQAIELERKQTQEQISLAKERARIIKANVGLGESMLEDEREAAQAQAEVIRLEAERDSRLKELTSQLRGFRSAQKSANEAVEEGIEIDKQVAIEAPKERDKLQERVEYGMQVAHLINQEVSAEENRVKKLIQFEKYLYDAKLQSATIGLNAVANLVNSFASQDEKRAEKIFKLQKGVAIAQAILDTYSATQSIFAAAAANPTTILFPAQPFIAAGAALAAGIANVNRIKNQQFQSSSVSASGFGGGGGVGVGQAPTDFNPITPTLEISEPERQIKVFVTETDIRNSTNTVSGIYNRAVVTE
jgi:hypothetical protein